MSRQASPTTNGAFVVGAIVLAIAAILLLAGDQWFRQDTSKFVMYFHGSVNGLNVGSPVMFRGVNIGTVTSIQLVVGRTETDVDIPVIVEVDNTRFVHTHPESPEAETGGDIDDLDQGWPARPGAPESVDLSAVYPAQFSTRHTG